MDYIYIYIYIYINPYKRNSDGKDVNISHELFLQLEKIHTKLFHIFF